MTTTAPVAKENGFGRKGGRGVRPWLLIPKVIAVAIYVGGLATVLGLWIVSDFASIPLGDPRRELVLRVVSRLMVFVVVAALLIAIALGIALFLQHPRIFARSRWFQVKAALIAFVIPVSHFYCRWCFTRLAHVTDAAINASLARQLTAGLIFALVGSCVIDIIGRLKPRCGQNPASLHPKTPIDGV
jgi:uncharacterized membrane protein